MKIRLTRRWKLLPLSSGSDARCDGIYLRCDPVLPVLWDRTGWIATASMGGIKRTGPIRRSITLTRQDAEKLAVELLRDIRDGAKAIMDQYGMGEDD